MKNSDAKKWGLVRITSMETPTTLTVKVSNIPPAALAADLLTFLERELGGDTVFAVEIFTEHENWSSRGHGQVQFRNPQAKLRALSLSDQRRLVFRGFFLAITSSLNDIIPRPVDERKMIGRIRGGSGVVLNCGVMVSSNCLGVLESWADVEVWVMPEKKRIEFFVSCYKLEVQFVDVVESKGCFLASKSADAVLLKLKHAPKVYQKVSGENAAPRFRKDRYHICKEDISFSWVRTTDFSEMKSIGYMSALCWEVEEGNSDLEVLNSLPCFSEGVSELTLKEGLEFDQGEELVPLVKDTTDLRLLYEVLFQLNSLVHTHKLSLASVDAELLEFFSRLEPGEALQYLQEMHKLPSCCYDPISFLTNQMYMKTLRPKNRTPLSASERLTNQNVMSCHRVLITPSRIFCLGPELESSNYIVRHFASYASDFMRVTFVDEDWGRLSVNAVSASTKKGIFAKPFKTKIYHRILSVLRDGIVIGEKRFEFLAFSASQLRSNSVWMFASNDRITAEHIRNWMGCFTQIRSISKCAARMGQLFSSSKPTIEVMGVELIPDIEVVTDGVKYCFSDGIGKISYAFAKELSIRLGLNHIPSAFQIRYGGYKGVIAVDRESYKKLSLRSSMLKFESTNLMLNITKCNDSQPCYLNREIITLLSTLGVEDEVFLEMQKEQLRVLGGILTNRDAAIKALEGSGGSEAKGIMGRMLLQGYEPSKEPYLSMMLRSHLDGQLFDLRTRNRIFVPKGRVLLGCLDESGILDYGQVYARVTLTKSELEGRGEVYFEKVDETTAVITGKVVVTKNPCLHPGDVRVLEAVLDVRLQETGLVDCLLFPKKGHRPHPNECSGGDLDGDLYFISWDKNLIPPKTVAPMDYTGRRPRIMDHDVTIEEIQKFFADYMISDALGIISNAHLVHADREPLKALSPKCLELANLHSMAVDFAKTGAPAEMPRALKPREFPDFMERYGKPAYASQNALGKLYRASAQFVRPVGPAEKIPPEEAFDQHLVVEGFEEYLGFAKAHKERYSERMARLMKYYGAEAEVEVLTGDLLRRSSYLERDNRRYGEVKERILVSAKSLMKEAKGWFDECARGESCRRKLASAWYVMAYHSSYASESENCLGFPWAVGDVLLDIKEESLRRECVD